jgi:DNA mismatch repair protein MutS
VIFLHRIAEGAADRSYGIHVARLAGLPESVLRRATEVLRELESERTVEHLEAAGRSDAAADPAAPGAPTESPPPLPLFADAPPELIAALRALEIEALTPLEALNRIAEWKRRYGGD